MPTIAHSALMKRLRETGELERLCDDFEIMTGRPLRFFEKCEGLGDDQVAVRVQVGVCELGALACGSTDHGAQDRAVEHLLALVAEALGQRLLEPTRCLVLPAKTEAAARLLREHFREPLRLSDVASELNISRERLSRLFHSSLGVTFSEYLNVVRLNHCRHLLRTTDKPITEIAFASGFQSLSQFNRRFLASEGMSPSAFRKRMRS